MKVAAFQMQAGGEPETRLNQIEEAMRKASADGADVLVAPELAITGYGGGPALRALAQAADGAWSQRLKQAVQEVGISVVVGFPEVESDARFISALIIDKDNPAHPLVYRKNCLYGEYEKGLFQTPDRSAVLTTMAGIKVGFLICYDVEFPENVRRLAQAGAQVILVPTAMAAGEAGRFIAQKVVPVRAFENSVFIVYVNHVGADEAYSYAGLSSIVAPDGQVLASAPEDEPKLISASIKPGDYEKTREENPYIFDALALGLID